MTLSEFWMDLATRRALKDVAGFDRMTVVDAWKMDGWNDGTATLFLVCRDADGTHKRITMADYSPTVVDAVEVKETTVRSWVAR